MPLRIAIFTMVWGIAVAIPIPQKDQTIEGLPIPIKISVPPVVLIPRYMWGRYDKETQTLVPYPGQANIYPVLTGYGLDAIRNLDPSVHWPIYDYLSYFDSIITDLQLQGWVPGYNLFGVPWDWRQSMCWPPTLDRLKETILIAKNITGKNVTLITHSMGGLVAKCFITTYPDIFRDNVDAWISIATPFQGASGKLFIEFLQGYNLGNIVIGPKDAKGLALESPAVYELLPRLEFQWDNPPQIALTLNGTRLIYGTDAADPAAAGTYESVLRRVLVRHNLTLPSGATLPEPFNDDVWALSESSRARAAAARLPPSVRFYNIVAMGQATPVGLDFGPVSRWEDLESVKYVLVMADGDGTVALESARAHGMAEAVVVAGLEVAADHMSVLMHPNTLEFVRDAVYDRL